MKLLRYYVLPFVALSLSPGCTHAAQPLEQNKKTTPTLILLNTTEDKVEVCFTVAEHKERVTLTKLDHCEIKQFTDLQELLIMPYGKIKGQLTKEVLSAGYVQQENHVNHPSIILAQEGEADCYLAIKTNGTTNQGFFGNIYNAIAGKVLPYRLKILHDFTPKNILKGLIFEFFPQVELAFNEGKDILPRYFLRLPENASKEEVYAGYQREIARWKNMYDKSSKESKRELASQIHSFLKEACKKLLGQNNSYDYKLFKSGLSKKPLSDVLTPNPMELAASESDSSAEEN